MTPAGLHDGKFGLRFIVRAAMMRMSHPKKRNSPR